MSEEIEVSAKFHQNLIAAPALEWIRIKGYLISDREICDKQADRVLVEDHAGRAKICWDMFPEFLAHQIKITTQLIVNDLPEG